MPNGPLPTGTPVFDLDRLDLVFAPRTWDFAEERRHAIEGHFSELARANATLYNGAVLLMHTHALDGAVLSGAYLETDYASFIAWRDWGFPDPSMRNCFALAAVRGSDGAFLLGVMAGHTSNAGRVYFPGGTPDPADIIEGRVDLEASARRELHEETGLSADEFDVSARWTLVVDGPRLALMKAMQASEPAAALRRRVLRHLAAQAQPELADIAVVARPSDLTPDSPAFVGAFLRHVWRQDSMAGDAAFPRL
jgi:8-oxo-dGTP pyrophosphatase MutT (NUDIX family)